ncbi:helix-turn-helix transcriptional regulator [Nocardiopsis nanhaiensis]
MALDEWSSPERSLAAVVTLLRAPLARSLPTLSEVMADVLPHRALLVLTGDCSESALRTYGSPELTRRTEISELVPFAEAVEAGVPWTGHAKVAGDEYPVLVVASSPDGSAGTLLTAVLEDGQVPSPAQCEVVQHLWDLTTIHVKSLNSSAEPAKLSQSRLVAGERNRAVTELTDTHAATLTGILGALRSRNLDDLTARRTATDLAASALVNLRTSDDYKRSQGEESLEEAFSNMANKLLILMRHRETALELGRPSRGEHPLPTEMATAARAMVRSSVLTMLEQVGVTRIRVAWDIEGATLVVSVRDDGPGGLTETDFGVRRLRTHLNGLDAELRVDAVSGWGTTISARLPLDLPGTTQERAVAHLNPREVDVLQQLVLGRRNRHIAQQLHISEHTVKYHVANILDKLSVSSRGEAAATARDLGLIPSHRGTAS